MEQSIRRTKQRDFILKTLQGNHEPLTAEEIFFRAQGVIHMNLSTVYRSLAALSAAGEIIKSVHSDGCARYLAAAHSHAHMLTCVKCHRSVELDVCPLDQIDRSIFERTGFTITGHHLSFTGICPACAEKKK